MCVAYILTLIRCFILSLGTLLCIVASSILWKIAFGWHYIVGIVAQKITHNLKHKLLYEISIGYRKPQNWHINDHCCLTTCLLLEILIAIIIILMTIIIRCNLPWNWFSFLSYNIVGNWKTITCGKQAYSCKQIFVWVTYKSCIITATVHFTRKIKASLHKSVF